MSKQVCEKRTKKRLGSLHPSPSLRLEASKARRASTTEGAYKKYVTEAARSATTHCEAYKRRKTKTARGEKPRAVKLFLNYNFKRVEQVILIEQYYHYERNRRHNLDENIERRAYRIL